MSVVRLPEPVMSVVRLPEPVMSVVRLDLVIVVVGVTEDSMSSRSDVSILTAVVAVC